jgi:DNA-binding HxlR family transcriptional regulator
MIDREPGTDWSPPHVTRVLDQFAGRWALPILKSLEGGPLRRRALRAQLGPVSDKVLTETLRRLEVHALVSRTAVPTVPVEVNYALTERARGLWPLLATIASWDAETPS